MQSPFKADKGCKSRAKGIMQVFADASVLLSENSQIILGWAEISCCTVCTVMESGDCFKPKLKPKGPWQEAMPYADPKSFTFWPVQMQEGFFVVVHGEIWLWMKHS